MTWLSDEVLAHVSAVSDAPDVSGTKYRLVRELGRGGMAVVYAAEDSELGREVALKVSTVASGEELALRLRAEAQVIAGLEHPGIVPVHDVGVLPDGRAYYAMKLVRGDRLDAWRADQDRRALLRVFVRICEAVAFAHAHGVIDRDLKPENVMVGAFGEALVMDWGLAKTLAADETAGAVLGTPVYMAPEQARGEALDARSDVHALGAVLYFLLAGRPPYEGATVREVLARVAAGARTPLRERVPDVPRPLAAICDKAMHRDPAQRYATALALAEDVGLHLEGAAPTAYREPIAERVLRFASRHRVALSLFGTYLVVRAILFLTSR